MKINKVLNIVFWVSPILKLFSTTASAVSDGYDERFIKDPGHNTVKILDKILISITWISAALIIFPSILHYQKIYSDENFIVILIIFFPYFANIYITILLYINSIILSIYNKNRKNIIRKINERSGVW